MPDQQKKILVAEDERPLAEALRLKLEKGGFSVVVVFDGESALQKIKEEHFDLIILDLIMPKKSGFEVLEEMPQKDIPVFVLSNLGQGEDFERVKKMGVIRYFIKSDSSLNSIVETVKKQFI